MNTRRLLERMARSSDPVLAAEAEKEIARLAAAKRASRARTAPRRAPGKAAKEAERAEYRAATALLRSQVIALADGDCERCGRPASPAEGHMHHTRGGIGRRRQEQSIGNVAWLCGHCHRYVHAHPDVARNLAADVAEARASSVRRAPEEV